jgi:L-lactate dehydrogenase complex protein LldG
MAGIQTVNYDRQRRALMGKIGDALAGEMQQRRAAAAAWLRRSSGSVPPRTALQAPSEEISRFAARARQAAAAVDTLGQASDIAGRIEATLAEWVISGPIVASADPALDPWLGARLRESLRFGRPESSDEVSITIAAAGIAETGTLVFISGPLSPASLAFLPGHLIAIVPASRIVASYNCVIPMLLKRGTSLAMPRCVNFVTGPSRTADIEEVLLIGAHGPRSVKILMVEGI